MDREKSSFGLGLILLAVGIVILMFLLVTALGLVANSGAFLRDQVGARAAPPQAFFAWTSNDQNATFQDLSSSGGAPIASRTWDFGDGASSAERDPIHVYAQPGDYVVRLTVRDDDGLEAVAAANINVGGGTNGGTAEATPNFNADFGTLLLPVAVAVLVTGLHIVGFLVGGSLVKAGWNLIRPRPETIRIRLKPQHLEQMAVAEVASQAAVLPPPIQPPTPEPPAPAPPPPEA